MALPEQKKKLLKAKIAVALHDELGRVPKKEEIDNVFLLARVMYKAVLGLHFQRQQQKTDNWRSSNSVYFREGYTSVSPVRSVNLSYKAFGLLFVRREVSLVSIWS
jgi:hypothetical protein